MATTAAPNKKEPFHRVFGDEQATRLIELYKRAEKEIGTKLLRAVLKAGTKKALSVRRLEQELKAVYKMLDELKKAGENASAEMVTASFNGGIAVARKQLKAAGIPLIAEMGGVHEKAMKVYSSMIGDRLADVVTTAGRTTADIYRQLQLDSVLTGTVAGYETINTTIRQMEKTGEAQGLVAFVDRSGKQWNMSTYVEMLARTTVMKIHNEAVKNEFVAHGEDLVIISYHLPTCEMCKPWNGRIVSLTGATKGYPTMTDAEAEGLFHPNCRHAFSLYIPDKADEGITAENVTPSATPFDVLQIQGTEKWNWLTGGSDIDDCYNTTNPNFATGQWEWRNNCQRCVPTYEMRRRGYDVQAKEKIKSNDDFAENHWHEAFENIQWTWKLPGTGKRAIEKQMKAWGNGARAEIYVAWKGGGAHVFIAENDNGVIKYICPQSGRKDYSYRFQDVCDGTAGIARIDNLKPSKWITHCCEPV